MWLNTSNLSPQDRFLLSLHEQLTDLQTHVYQTVGNTKESRYYSIAYDAVPSTSVPSTSVPSSSSQRTERWLNHLFRHRLVLEPNVMVWRMDEPLEPSDPHRFRAYIQFNRPVSEKTLTRFLRLTPESPLRQRWVSPLDSYEFIQAVVQWIPLNPGIRAWCRFVHPIEPDFTRSDTALPFTNSPHYTDSNTYQEKLREMWFPHTLNQLLELNYD